MISLSHLIGALLKDIAQARMSSDTYSRDISRYYEQDPLLRGFSVPRADIESVEFELKFALKGAQLAHLRVPLVMRFYDDLSYPEIAETLQLTNCNVRKRVQLAYGRLRTALSSDREDSSAPRPRR